MTETKRGVYIAFEGIGGCGKTTQSRLALDYLHQLGIPAIRTREPGGTPVAEKIRELLFSIRSQDELISREEFLILSVSRSLTVRQLVEPRIAKGEWVLSDRSLVSSNAYQGGGGGLSSDRILEVGRFSVGGRLPDFVFYYDVTVKEAQRRRGLDCEGDPFDKEIVAYWRRVARRYQEMNEENWGEINWIRINGMRSLEQVTRRTCGEMDKIVNIYRS